ncbi:MAG: hypothetical protein AAFX99_35340, partial [Myxococcota bacterium]
ETLLPHITMTEVRREQLSVLDELYFKPAVERSILDMLQEHQDDPSWGHHTSLWYLNNNDTRIYEAYMYGADSGTVFKAGTTEVVAEIVQSRLQPYDRAAGLAIAMACEESDLWKARNFTIHDAWSWR